MTTIEVPKDLLYKLIVDMEDNIRTFESRTSDLEESEINKYHNTKKNFFELKRIFLTNNR